MSVQLHFPDRLVGFTVLHRQGACTNGITARTIFLPYSAVNPSLRILSIPDL